ncbi:AAA family ATPase [soil metagenome]
MPDTTECTEILSRYLKARVPFISVRTDERGRAIAILRELAGQIKLPFYLHTLSQGVRDITTGRTVYDERSLPAALEFSTQQVHQRQQLTFVFTDVNGLEDETDIARQFYDLVMLAADNNCSLVVLTSKPVWSSLQRLGMTVTLDRPTEDEMFAFVQDLVDGYHGQIPIEWEPQDFRQAASILAGITQFEAENVINTLLVEKAVRKSDLEKISHAKDRMFSDLAGIERVHLRHDVSIGGLAGLRTWLDQERPLLTADLRDRQMRPPRGVLLVGVPGCGKSLSAKAIAASWNLPLYRLDMAAIHGQYLGQSESRLKEALATADHVAPCVLWIDEIEKGLAGAGGFDGGTSTRVIGQFLFWLQESRARVFVVATANDVSGLPPELLRRGRFDELFFHDLPTPEERTDIIQLYVRKSLRCIVTDELIEELVEISDGFTGADLEAAVREVAKEAIRRGDDALTDDIFRQRFRNIVPLMKVNPERVEGIRNWGRERALPASGVPIGGMSAEPHKAGRRVVLS